MTLIIFYCATVVASIYRLFTIRAWISTSLQCCSPFYRQISPGPIPTDHNRYYLSDNQVVINRDLDITNPK